MSKHTLGPWFADLNMTKTSNGRLITTISAGPNKTKIFSVGALDGDDPEEIRANANICAAELDMYGALKDLRQRFHAALIQLGTGPEYADIACAKADAALAKAEGRS